MEKIRQNRTFWGVAIIPIAFVLTSFFMELAMFVIIGVAFPRYYVMSLLFLIAFAGAVSCIPWKRVQIPIFIICIGFQTVTTIANLIAFNNLGEIFIWETLRSMREVLGGTGAVKYDGTLHYIIISFIVLCFVGVCTFVAIKFRNQPAGYPMRKLAAVGASVMIVIAGMFAHLVAIDRRDGMDRFELLMDPRFNLRYFSDRTMVLFTFGSPIYYFNNLLALIGLKSMAGSPVVYGIDRNWYTWDEHEGWFDQDLMLDANYNAIMLMMEGVELDAIHPLLTPNLWWLQSNSTWVDGFYSIERTCFAEYLSLVGGHVQGKEMWRDRMHVARPHSMPNVFRRSFLEAGRANPQIGAFHTYWDEFYNRNQWFLYPRLGFDFLRDLNYYSSDDINFSINWAAYSDYQFMRYSVQDVAPVDRPFFTYFLNVSTHSPHFASPILRHRNGAYESVFHESLEFVLANRTELETVHNFRRLREGYTRAVRTAAMAWLVSMVEFDRAVGLLLDHLHSTGLIENTALIIYSDHFNHNVYNRAENVPGGALTSPNYLESPIGEKTSFMIFNPRDGLARSNYMPYGRRITTFSSTVDVYKTVAHLFNIPVHGNFTLGSSILQRGCCCCVIGNDYPISVGIGFINNRSYFGTCLFDRNVHFTTTNFRDFNVFRNSTCGTPAFLHPYSIAAYRARMHYFADTLLKLRSTYDRTSRFRFNYHFARDYRTFYRMGSKPVPFTGK